MVMRFRPFPPACGVVLRPLSGTRRAPFVPPELSFEGLEKMVRKTVLATGSLWSRLGKAILSARVSSRKQTRCPARATIWFGMRDSTCARNVFTSIIKTRVCGF